VRFAALLTVASHTGGNTRGRRNDTGEDESTQQCDSGRLPSCHVANEGDFYKSAAGRKADVADRDARCVCKQHDVRANGSETTWGKSGDRRHHIACLASERRVTGVTQIRRSLRELGDEEVRCWSFAASGQLRNWTRLSGASSVDARVARNTANSDNAWNYSATDGSAVCQRECYSPAEVGKRYAGNPK